MVDIENKGKGGWFMKLKIFGGPTHEVFAKKVCDQLGLPLGKINWRQFACGEREPQFGESIRKDDVYIIQSTHQPDENLINLCLSVNAAKNASAGKVTAVVPYYGWARQDKKVKPRTPISAKLMAGFITIAGADEVILMDLHNGSIQGFFNKTPDHLFAKPFFVDFLNENLTEDIKKDLKILVPDAGAVLMGESYGKHLGLTAKDIAITIKIHGAKEKEDMESLDIAGKVEGKYLIPLDDMVDTATTLCDAVNMAVNERGALGIPMACAVHPVLSGDAVQRIEKSPIQELIVSDTIPLPKDKQSKNIEVISATGLFAEAIKRVHRGESLSELFI